MILFVYVLPATDRATHSRPLPMTRRTHGLTGAYDDRHSRTG